MAENQKQPVEALRREAHQLLLRRWGELNPTAALAAVRALGDQERSVMEGAIVRGWASVAPVAAFDWCLRPDAAPVMRLQPLYDLLETLVETRRFPELATRLAAVAGTNRVGVFPPTPISFSRFVTSWAEDAPEEAYAWANALPTGRAKRDALLGAITGMCEDAPDLAFEYARSFPAAEERGIALANVVRNWAQQDAAAARAVITTKLSGTDRDEALATFSYTIAQSAPRDAIDGLQGIENVERRSRAADELRSRFIRTTQLERAAEVSVRSFPAAQREDALLGVFILWKRQDPAAAERFRIGSPLLTPALRAALTASDRPKS